MSYLKRLAGEWEVEKEQGKEGRYWGYQEKGEKEDIVCRRGYGDNEVTSVTPYGFPIVQVGPAADTVQSSG